jgi:predicted alpha/beta superfamily hydrolase
MRFSFRKIIFIIGFLCTQAIIACTSRTSTQTPGSTPALVTIPLSQVRQLNSTATGRNYDLYVRLPNKYTTDLTKQYPVVYLLDGQWDFKMLDSIQSGLEYDKFVPEMIIVGITYSGDNPDYEALRAMDYTPVKDASIKGSGDAPKFLAFLKEQLIPFIETNFRADPTQRVLMGSSFGGTFTLFALFSEPTLFSGYVASSPVTVYGSNFAFKQEEAYAGSHKDLPVKLFLGVGEMESLKLPVQKFMDVLRARNYTGFKMETRIIEGEGHASNKPEIYNRGLRFVFQD